MLYWPERDTALRGTLNQSAAPVGFSHLTPVAAIVPAVMCELRQRPTSPVNGA
jgi:hypothetical protein